MIINKMKNLSSPEELDAALRPKTWSEYVGQDQIKKNLKVIIGASSKRGEPCCEHILFYGHSGLGKTSLALLMAKEMKAELITTSGPAIEKAGDLAAILTNLKEGNILFIDEIHRLHRTCEEILYPALEDFHLHLVIGRGPMARTIDLALPRFTLVAATTKPAMISSPLRNRFGASFPLNFYSLEEIGKIISLSSQKLSINIESSAIKEIANRSRLTPRIANRLLKRVRDFSEMENQKKITLKTAQQALDFLGVDEMGLEESDRSILRSLIEKFNGGPAGLQALSSSSLEDAQTIKEISEPYLLQTGLIERTPRGRVVTKKAINYMKKWLK
jgi:holliday junction DNA helicase RuvB